MATQAVHAGSPQPRIEGAVATPIFQSSTYVYGDDGGAVDYHDIRYMRLSNSPNHVALHEKIACLEGGEDALVAGSGMAAISTALLSVLKSGEHLLAQKGLYGGTHTFMLHELPQVGVAVDFVDLDDPEEWRAKLRENTRAFYVESITNPLLQVGDLRGAVGFAREHGLVSLIDNTLPSPVNFRPLEVGFDLVLHSATKYMGGHSDIVAGAVVGGAELVRAAKLKLDHLGGTLDANACFLLERGMKTMPLRVARQSENALALARMLEGHQAVTRVYYPGLESHPNAARARELFGGFGGMFSFEHRAGAKGARGVVRRLKLASQAVSLGGVETLVTLPAETSHAGLTAAERKALGIADGLVRVAVGIEGEEDLLGDFEQALGG